MPIFCVQVCGLHGLPEKHSLLEVNIESDVGHIIELLPLACAHNGMGGVDPSLVKTSTADSKR